MPFYLYACPQGHRTEVMRKMKERHEPFNCSVCKAPTALVIAAPHVPVDGIYSYAPNGGSVEHFERNRAKLIEEKRMKP